METNDILLIITDQQAAGALSCTGHKDIHTPALDILVNNGMRFNSAYCTLPSAVPPGLLCFQDSCLFRMEL